MFIFQGEWLVGYTWRYVIGWGKNIEDVLFVCLGVVGFKGMNKFQKVIQKGSLFQDVLDLLFRKIVISFYNYGDQ